VQIETSNESSTPRSVRIPIDPDRPSERALDHLDAAGRRTRSRATRIRRSFINADRGAPPTPLSSIVKGGRAGGLRLRLMLALLWMGGGGDERHTVSFPARGWAELLDLDDPAGAGQRRIRDALSWLERQRLIAVSRAAGRPSVVTLLREDGSGERYVSPVKAPKDPATRKLRERDWSVSLPSTFWTKGWVLALSTPALALLLVMLEVKREDRRFTWVSPDEARRRFGLSPDTWTRGIAELEGQGLVSVRRQPVDRAFAWRRVRNSYELNLSRLNGEPRWASS
jgi:hypothetical protein